MTWTRIFCRAGWIALAGLVAILLSALGGLIAWWLGDLLIDMHFIRPNGNIDDDAAIINMGIAFVGAIIGFSAGLFMGWRVRPRGAQK